MVVNDSLDDRDRGVPNLAIHAAHILADDTEQHRVYADRQEDEGGEGSEAGGPCGMEHNANKCIADHEKDGEKRSREAEVGGESKGHR